jgi:hypothetical protein
MLLLWINKKMEVTMKRALILLNIGMTILMSILLGCNQKEHTTQFQRESRDTLLITEPEIITEEISAPVFIEKKEYEIQLMASQNLTAIEKEKQKFLQAGYVTKIVPKRSNGKTFYRLRLEELFTKDEAFAKAKTIENDFQTIQKAWIQKML